MRKTKKAAILIPLLLMLGTAACAGKPAGQIQDAATSAKETESLQETPAQTTKEPETTILETEAKTSEEETAKVDILLTSAPEIALSDALSSAYNRFEVRSGDYSWSYLDGKDTVSMVACGSHPLDANLEKAEKLKVPEYNRIEAAPYTVSAVVAPDRLTVREWDISQLGDMDAAAQSEADYEEAFIINLKPDKVYEIVAVWDEAKLEGNGFSGEASYVVITE